MNADSFDKKMEEIRNEEVKKLPVGRPRGPEKVVYKRNVLASVVPVLDEFLAGAERGYSKARQAPKTLGAGNPIVSPQLGEVNELKSQIKLLLEDNERMVRENAAIEERLRKVARMTENEKLAIWIHKYDELKKVYDLRVGGSVYSQ